MRPQFVPILLPCVFGPLHPAHYVHWPASLLKPYKYPTDQVTAKVEALYCELALLPLVNTARPKNNFQGRVTGPKDDTTTVSPTPTIYYLDPTKMTQPPLLNYLLHPPSSHPPSCCYPDKNFLESVSDLFVDTHSHSTANKGRIL